MTVGRPAGTAAGATLAAMVPEVADRSRTPPMAAPSVPFADAAPDEIAAAVDRARRAVPGWAALGFAARGRALNRLVRGLVRSPDLVPTPDRRERQAPLRGRGHRALLHARADPLLHRPARPAGAGRRSRRHPFLFTHKRRASCATSARRGRRDRAVELAAAQQLRRLRRAAAGRQRGRAQAVRADAADVAARSRALCARPACPDGVFQVVTGRRRRRAGAGRRRRHGLLHRQPRGRPRGGAGRGRAPRPGGARAGRQVGDDRARRRRPERRPRAPRCGAPSRTAARSASAPSGCCVEEAVADRFVELVRRERRAAAPGAPAGEPARRLVDVGAMTVPPQIAVCERQVADAVARGAAPAAPAARRAPAGRAVVRADGARRRDARHGGDARGDLRPGAADPARARRRGGAARSPTTRRWGCRAASGRATSTGARALARRLETGNVCINDVLVNYFCVEAPLGGIKGQRARLSPRPRGAAAVLPRRDHRRGPPAARLAQPPGRAAPALPLRRAGAAAHPLDHAALLNPRPSLRPGTSPGSWPAPPAPISGGRSGWVPAAADRQPEPAEQGERLVRSDRCCADAGEADPWH